jgi:hypothetical protein
MTDRDAPPPEALARAAQLLSALENLQAAAPARAEGVDAGGTVRMVLGPDGLPVEMRVLAVPSAPLGAAVEDAFSAASTQRLQTWPEIERAPVPRDPDPPPVPAGAGRRVEEIAEDVIAALREAVSIGPAGPEGAGSVGGLVLTVSYAAGVRCSADPGWVARQDAAGLEDALAAALRGARAALGEVPPRRPLDLLLAEARAGLTRSR